MPQVALMTIGLLHAPWGDPRVQGFVDRIEPSFAAAAASPGFVLRVGAPGGPDGGPHVVPAAFADAAVEARAPQTLSVWRDLESAFAFSYRGIHGASLRDRHAWFAKIDAPSHVAWWIGAGHVPTWAESAGRYAELALQGPTSRAFDFRSPFDAEGRAWVIDREAVRRYAQGSPTIAAAEGSA